MRLITCSKCKKENLPNSTFCGFCGSVLKTDLFVLNGKKNKKSYLFINKLYNSSLLNILFIAAFALFLLYAIGVEIYSVWALISKYDSLGYHISQIAVKYEYLAEGVSISYIASSLIPVIEYMLYAIIAVLMLINIPVAAFNVYFGCYLIGFKKKKLSGIVIGKPVTLVKLSVKVLNSAILLNIILIGIIIVISLFKSYLGW